MTLRLAPDPAVPQRDALLDARRMGAWLGAGLTGAAADRCERLNAKYRVGDSLRVVYRVAAGGGLHTVAGRTFAGRSAGVHRRAAAASAGDEPLPAASAGDGPLPAVLHAPEFDTVFWRFPHDRRLSSLRLLDGGSAALDRLVGRPVARTRLLAYAPERAATAECRDVCGHVVAYVKLHWDAAEREVANVAAAAAAVGPSDPHLRLPRVLAAALPDGALALEPLPGIRLDGLAGAELGSGLHALGAGLARLHAVRPLPSRRFERLDAERLAVAAGAIGRVRPDCRRAAAALLERLLAREDGRGGEPVHLHGDVNLRNALLDSGRIALVDLEDAAAGPAAADLGLVLAGLLLSGEQERRAAALLGGYAQAGALPGAATLRWHTAASALARVALPAVGRVRPAVLARLEPLLHAAGELVG